MSHWCACIWFCIHWYFERETKYTWATTDCPGGDSFANDGCLATWDEISGTHNICDRGLIRHCYIRSIYFVITTLSTVGYGE